MTLPTFIVIGIMKCGTTSVAGWLEAHPDVFMTEPKEPAFFSRPSRWAKGLGWYGTLFDAGRDTVARGEASTMYTNPAWSAVAAERIARTVPDVRLVCVVRDPVERIRSHYRHRRLRGREARPLAEAVVASDSPYVAQSCYYRCLEPYITTFGADRLRVERLEDLADGAGDAWRRVLDHIGVAQIPHAGGARKVSAETVQLTPLSAKLRARVPRSTRLPAPVRRLGHAFLTRRGKPVRATIDASRDTIPPAALDPVWDDVARLGSWLEVDLGWGPSR